MNLVLTQIIPELLLTSAGLIILLWQAFFRRSFVFGFLVSLVSLAYSGYLYLHLNPGAYFSDFIITTLGTNLINAWICGLTFLFLLYGPSLLRRDGWVRGEYFVLVLWSTVGLSLLIRGGHLLTWLIGLEVLSLGLYCLTAYYQDGDVAVEAAVKYFFMGAFASAWFVLGIAFYYGSQGDAHIQPLQDASMLGTMAWLFILLPFAFKLALVPLHGWAPDVYQGSPGTITAYLATLPKVAAIIVFTRILFLMPESWLLPVLSACAMATMFAGNLIALAQRDVKRLLAYSGIAHAGYLLVGLITGKSAWAETVFYVLIYALMSMTAFALASLLGEGERQPHHLRDYQGLGWKKPWWSFVFTLSLLSLAGIPPLAGFSAKFFLFKKAVDAGYIVLAFIAILNSIISLFYYIRVIYVMYMLPPEKEMPSITLPGMVFLATLISAGGLLYLGIFPHHLLLSLQKVVITLFQGG